MLKCIPIVPRHVTAIWWHYPGLPDFYQGRSIPTSVLRLSTPALHWVPWLQVYCLSAIIVILVAAKVIWWLHQDLLLSLHCSYLHCSYLHCQYNKRSHPLSPGLQSPHIWCCNPWIGLQHSNFILSLSLSLSLSLQMNLTYRTTSSNGNIKEDKIVLSEKNCSSFKHRFSKVKLKVILNQYLSEIFYFRVTTPLGARTTQHFLSTCRISSHRSG